MTKIEASDPGQPGAELSEILHDAGLGDDAVSAIVRIDALMQNWRRRMHKRELGHRALATLGIPLDLAQFDVLAAIDGASVEFGKAGDETMVGTVAERLAIDPSRASRMVADMVTAGYARREVSQADARRTVIALTPAGRAITEAVRAYKWLLLGDFLGTWAPEELDSFVSQLEHFGEWSSNAAEGEAKFATRIAALADLVKASHADETETPAAAG